MDLWKVKSKLILAHIYYSLAPQKIADGGYTNIITTMEQLKTHEGHMGKLARLIRKDRKFVSRIKRVAVDEAHTIYTAGIPKHNKPAHRPAYGYFNTIRPLFLRSTSVMALSATLPTHILKTVQRKLSIPADHLFIHLSSNRPNIMYATHPIIGSLRDFRNLSFLIPKDFHPPMQIPPTLVFHDNKTNASDAATYVDSLLPPGLRGTGLSRHYHSLMSSEYLEQVYSDFTGPYPSGIIHTTPSMQSVSLLLV